MVQNIAGHTDAARNILKQNNKATLDEVDQNVAIFSCVLLVTLFQLR